MFRMGHGTAPCAEMSGTTSAWGMRQKSCHARRQLPQALKGWSLETAQLSNLSSPHEVSLPVAAADRQVEAMTKSSCTAWSFRSRNRWMAWNMHPMWKQVMLQLVSTEDTIAKWTAKTISDHYGAFHDISASAASACAKLLQACAHCWPRSHALAKAAVMEPATCGLTVLCVSVSRIPLSNSPPQVQFNA